MEVNVEGLEVVVGILLFFLILLMRAQTTLLVLRQGILFRWIFWLCVVKPLPFLKCLCVLSAVAADSFMVKERCRMLWVTSFSSKENNTGTTEEQDEPSSPDVLHELDTVPPLEAHHEPKMSHRAARPTTPDVSVFHKRRGAGDRGARTTPWWEQHATGEQPTSQ